MVMDHSYSFRLAARVILYVSSHRQDNIPWPKPNLILTLKLKIGGTQVDSLLNLLMKEDCTCD